MIDNYENSREHLEWEILEAEQMISQLKFEHGSYNLREDCVINFSRDNQYKLIATISGLLNHPKDIEGDNKALGKFIEKDIVTGYSSDKLFIYKFWGVTIGNFTVTPFSASDTIVKFIAAFDFDNVDKHFIGVKNPTEYIYEWYLGSESNIHFHRSTERSFGKIFKRIRRGIDEQHEPDIVKGYSVKKDFILITTSDISCIIAKVPKDFGPEWSFNLCIEYRSSFGNILSENEREAVAEFVSFIFGCQLMKIGQTSYDKSHSYTLQTYKNPWGNNVISKCQKGCIPPLDIEYYRAKEQVEKLINEMLPYYLQLKKQFRLKDVLWKYWIAKHSPFGTNLPILSSALETLAEQVLKNHPEKKHFYIETTKFQEMIGEELTTIDTKLDNHPDKDKIMNKIRGASQRGANEKLEMMFEILKFKVDKIERKALKARNKMAHSSLGEISMDETKKLIKLTRAYETLFHRVFLKLLNYNGSYIDYYTIGHPRRHIDDPIPEG